MRYVAGERIEAGETIYVGPDGTVRPMRRETPGNDFVLRGGPADGRKGTLPLLPEIFNIKDGWHPVDEASGVADEYVPTDRRDDEGRTIYEHRRQRYTAESGMWRPV